ncbi:MAG: hypothetical protein FJZ92_10120 [Chloroflexi bacterium]|nr:hypothetical protein [Chloroflexota bacterium]
MITREDGDARPALSRRALLRGATVGAGALAAAALVGCTDAGAESGLIARLSYNTASGGGVNLKMMPDPMTGRPTVPMLEVFSFDRNYAFCRVETNPQAFKMKTFALGEVTIQPNEFFMSMHVTQIDKWEISTKDGKPTVTMRGGLDCATEVGKAASRLGSREVAEHATFLVEAVDGGIGGGKAGDRFAFTAFFNEKEAPVNYKIFGKEFTFTGEMVAGEITILDPKA